MTHAALNKAFERIEQQRNNLFDRLKIYDDKVLNQKPDEASWSVIEVLRHLTAAEDFSAQYLDKKTKDVNAGRKTGLKEAFRSFLLNAYLGSPKKFKAPDIAVPLAGYATLADTRASWDIVRGRLQDIWKGLPAELLDRNWFKHPVAGKLNLMQMLTFMEAHASRHEKQIWRALKEVSDK